MWLAIKNRLVTHSLRFTRKLTDDAICPQCGKNEEIVLHILRHCVTAQTIWQIILTPEALSKFDAIPDNQWFKMNLKGNLATRVNVPASGPAIFMATVWNLWLSRNSKVFKGHADSKQRCLLRIKQLSWELNLRLNPLERNRRISNWKKPKNTWVKLNVDGSCKPSLNIGGISGVLRDSEGNWIEGFTETILHPFVNETELRSILKGLTLAWEQRIPHLLVETDSQDIFEWLTEAEQPPPEAIDEVEQWKILLRNPWEIELSKINRSANECADHLARLGCDRNFGVKLWQNPPISGIPILGTDSDF